MKFESQGEKVDFLLGLFTAILGGDEDLEVSRINGVIRASVGGVVGETTVEAARKKIIDGVSMMDDISNIEITVAGVGCKLSKGKVLEMMGVVDGKG